MDIKYNETLGYFVNTANDEPITQEELLQWADENPEPLEAPKKANTTMMRDLLKNLTAKETPDNT